MLIKGVLLYPESSDIVPALRANLLCCFLGAMAAGFIAVTIYTLMHYNLPGQKKYSFSLESMAGSMLFAFSPLVWEYSRGAEVFSLNNLLCAILLFLTVEYARSGKNVILLYTGAFFCGLGLTNQHTIGSYIPLASRSVLKVCTVLFEVPLIGLILFDGRHTITLKIFAFLALK